MKQKVNPHGLRVGVTKGWDSRWFAEGDFAGNLVGNYDTRKFLKRRPYTFDASSIEIERTSGRVYVVIYTAKPGVITGEQGAEAEELRKRVAKLIGKKVFIDTKEIRKPDREAQPVAEDIAQQLENRTSFRRMMKSVMQRSIKSGVLGIKTYCVDRLGGAGTVRGEFYSEGTISLQVLCMDIDYDFAEASAAYGKVGVKVWIHKGEVLPARAEARKGSAK